MSYIGDRLSQAYKEVTQTQTIEPFKTIEPMPYTRRKFVAHLGVGTLTAMQLSACVAKETKAAGQGGYPLAVSTWPFGKQANEAAQKILDAGGKSIDAVEEGVRVIEADPTVQSVGLGGLPDRDGHVTLDACIMDSNGNAGSVAFLEHILHPVSVARRVMERTPHVMLVGEGALQYALSEGFEKVDLLTPEARKRWEEWLQTAKYEPVINAELHDTIGMLAIDQAGDLAGACTTSGMAFKMRGRVGDSPIIGAGLYVDNELGGATATGLGEAVMRTCSSFLVVELMRQGLSPTDACRNALERIMSKFPGYEKIQVGLIAINKAGEVGAMSLQPDFSYALYRNGQHEVLNAPHLLG